MASNKQNPESQVQFVADENLSRETHHQSVSMRVKRRRPLVSIENTLPQPAVVTPEIVQPTRPIPPVGNQSVMKGAGGRRSHKRPAENVAIAGTEGSKKRLRRL